MTECKVQSVSINPQLVFSVMVGGIVIPLFVNCDVSLCTATFAITFSRVSQAATPTNPAGNLRFILFADCEPIDIIPLPVALNSQSISFTTRRLDCNQSLIVAVESDLATDITRVATVTLASEALTYSACCQKDCCCHKRKK
jgi:hypothetical protein